MPNTQSIEECQQELLHYNINFQLELEIGSGSQGRVYKAYHPKTGNRYALKKVDITHPCTVDEATILNEFRHAHIIHLVRFWILEDRALVMLLELCDCDLYTFIKNHDMSEFAPVFAPQILSAVDNMHSYGLMHRDIKTPNIMISSVGNQIKIGDFGSARVMAEYERGDSSPYTAVVTTIYYRPPEILFGDTDHTTKIDIWSVGCVLAEMVLGSPLIRATTEDEAILTITQLVGTPDETSWPGCLELPHFNPSFPKFPGNWAFRGLTNTDVVSSLARAALVAFPGLRPTVHELLHGIETFVGTPPTPIMPRVKRERSE